MTRRAGREYTGAMEDSMPGVSANFAPLIGATAVFVLTHFALSFTPVRARLVDAMGENFFLIVYSTVAVASFVWMIYAFMHAPFYDLWGDPAWARWMSVALMPVAAVLLAAGMSTRSPAAVGGGGLLAEGRGPVGIQKVTRHPVMMAIALWAALHLITNGDAASSIMFGGILILALGGVAHIEARKHLTGGAAWARFAAQSSVLPFAAILAGRARVGLAEIGWNRLLAGLVLYFVLLFGHRFVVDAPILPGLFGR